MFKCLLQLHSFAHFYWQCCTLSKKHIWKHSYTSVMGSPSYSSPIFMVGESTWITSIGKWRTCVKARSCKIWKIKKNPLLKWIEKYNKTLHCVYYSIWQLRRNSLPVVHPKLMCAPHHCSISQTHLEAKDKHVNWILTNIAVKVLLSLPKTQMVSPVVYMSPVLGLVRKGRKSSGWPLMCSAVRDRSSFTLVGNWS